MWIVTLAATVQTAAGFGFGIVAVPLLLWVSLPLPEAMALMIGAGLSQVVIGLWTTRKEIRWGLSVRIATAQWLMIPVGVLAMTHFLADYPQLIKQAVGVVLLSVLAARAFIRPTPRPRVPAPWAYVAGGSAGLLGGLVGMGGPPLVLFAMAHDWTKDRFRTFLWTQFLLGTPVLLLVLGLRVGWETTVAFASGVILMPGIWLGTRIGFAVTRRWRREQIQRIATALLVLLAMSAAVSPWIG